MDPNTREWLIVGVVILIAIVYTFWPQGDDDE